MLGVCHENSGAYARCWSTDKDGRRLVYADAGTVSGKEVTGWIFANKLIGVDWGKVPQC